MLIQYIPGTNIAKTEESLASSGLTGIGMVDPFTALGLAEDPFFWTSSPTRYDVTVSGPDQVMMTDAEIARMVSESKRPTDSIAILPIPESAIQKEAQRRANAGSYLNAVSLLPGGTNFDPTGVFGTGKFTTTNVPAGGNPKPTKTLTDIWNDYKSEIGTSAAYLSVGLLGVLAVSLISRRR
jgi:hypothetical protein